MQTNKYTLIQANKHMHTHRYNHTNTCICIDIINKKVASTVSPNGDRTPNCVPTHDRENKTVYRLENKGI